MSQRNGGGAIRIAVAATSAVRRAGLESIVRSHAEFQLAGSFEAVANLVSFVRRTELDVIVIDSDSIPDLLFEPTSDAAIVLLTEVSDARSISRLLRSGVRAILSRESDPDDVLSAIYAAYDGLVLLNTPTAESLAAVFGDQLPEVEDELVRRDHLPRNRCTQNVGGRTRQQRYRGASRYLRAYGQVPHQLDSRQTGSFHPHRSGYAGSPARANSDLNALAFRRFFQS